MNEPRAGCGMSDDLERREIRRQRFYLDQAAQTINRLKRLDPDAVMALAERLQTLAHEAGSEAAAEHAANMSLLQSLGLVDLTCARQT